MPWLRKQRRRNPATGRMEDYWSIGFRDHDQKMCTEMLGYVRKREANKRFAIRQGELLAEGPLRQSPTLEQYLETDYLPARKQRVARRTWEHDTISARVVCRVLGHLRLDQLDYAAVDRYLLGRLALGRKPTTVGGELILIRGALKRAVLMGALAELPNLPGSPKMGDHIKVRKSLTGDQTAELLVAMAPYKGTENGWAYVCVLLAVNTGLRRGEILSRTWEDVDWEARILHVGAKPEVGFQVKTRQDRVFPIPELLEKELRDYHRSLGSPSTGWIFPASRDSSQRRFDFRYLLRKGCLEAGIKVVNPHALRRTWATRLAINHADRASILRLGGWSSGKMLDEVYAQVTPEHVAEVARSHGIGPRKRGR